MPLQCLNSQVWPQPGPPPGSGNPLRFWYRIYGIVPWLLLLIFKGMK